MNLVEFSRRVTVWAVMALLLLILAGGSFLWRLERLHGDVARLLELQIHAQDLVDGATALAQAGGGPVMMRAFERDARAVQRQMRTLGTDFPNALAAAQTVDLLLRDARRLVPPRQDGPAGAVAPNAFLAERQRASITDHGIAMRSSLVEAVLSARARLVGVNRIVSLALVALSTLLLGGILAAALVVDRRIGRPLAGLYRSIQSAKDGNPAPAPDPGHRDEVGDVIGAFNDLLARRTLLEGAVGEQQDMLRMAGEVARFGAWRYDIAADRVTLSPGVTEILDEEPGVILDFDTAIEYFEGEDRERARALNRACLQDGEPYDDVFRFRTARDRLIWVRAVAQPTLAADGTILGAHGALQDVTDLREARDSEERQTLIAMEAQKHESIGRLTGGVAHDFNNLLAVVLANLEMLRDDETDDERLRMFDSAIEASLRGADLTRSMLAFARRAPLEPQVIDLNEVVEATRKMAARTLPSTVRLETVLLPDLWPVRADRSATESALLNLIVNANHAMPEGGNLTIETTNLRMDADYILSRDSDIPPGDYVMLGVSDTGTGIAPDVMQRIFDPFFTTKGPEGGSGLGLSMVQGFVRQSGGMLRVYSEPGSGTAFKLFFPAILDGDAEADDAAEGPAQESGAGRRILLVEDEAEVLTALARVLELAGYEVATAAGADEALALFEADQDFDLIVTDVVMPGTLQGPGLVRAVRQRRPEFPAVFISGYAAGASLHGNGLRQGDIRLMKPLQRTQFLAGVARAISGARVPKR